MYYRAILSQILLLIVAQWLLVGCGKDEQRDPRKYAGIHPEFREFVDSYKSRSGLSIGDLSMNFEDLPDNVAGRCSYSYYNGTNYPEVLVDPEVWDKMSKAQHENLVYHELGHCVQGLGHREELQEDGCPNSLMYHQVLSTSCLSKHTDHYLSEFFSSVKGIWKWHSY